MKSVFLVLIIFITYCLVSSCTLDYTRTKADGIIENIELYKQENGNYPEKLSDLVPEYYNKVPIHYSSLMDCNYKYFYDEERGGYSLSYTYFYPYGRYFYGSEKKVWVDID